MHDGFAWNAYGRKTQNAHLTLLGDTKVG
ncbi:hypothetical protein RSAG8_09101, partial [Rhizoctonia solani AG-8 WAC10335]